VGQNLREVLEELLHEGHVDEEWNEESGDHAYSLTGSGMEYAEEMVRNDPDAQIFLFSLMWNEKVTDAENPWGEAEKKLLRIAAELKKEPGINILRTLWEHRDKYEGGFAFKEKPPEDLLEKFDPEEEVIDGSD
jgi:hypothetical protein